MLEMHVPYGSLIRVVSKRDFIELELDEHLVDVDRTNEVLGNPYKITETQTREQAISLFCEMLEHDISSQGRMSKAIDALATLVRGGDRIALRCWCAPMACHADHIRLAIIKRLEET